MAMDWKSKEFAKQYTAGEAMTGPFGMHLIQQCGLDRADDSEDIILFDNATGTGIVLEHLYGVLPAAANARTQIVAGDISPSMIEVTQKRAEKNGWTNLTAKVVDATAMDLPSNHFTHVITNFALVGIPDPRAALREVFRVLRPSGIAAFSIWKTVGWYGIAEAAVASIPGAPPLPRFEDFGKLFVKNPQPGDENWIKPEFFEEQFRAVGFEDVQWELHANETRYKDAEEYVGTFTTMTNMIISNTWSAEEKQRLEPLMRQALTDELTKRFGDGEIVLHWEAYCVTARAPTNKA